jgi:hypothetical protein
MTSGQRKVHVLLWLVLGPAALVGLILAVLWRPVEPVQDGDLPGILQQDAAQRQAETRLDPGGQR